MKEDEEGVAVKECRAHQVASKAEGYVAEDVLVATAAAAEHTDPLENSLATLAMILGENIIIRGWWARSRLMVPWHLPHASHRRLSLNFSASKGITLPRNPHNQHLRKQAPCSFNKTKENQENQRLSTPLNAAHLQQRST